MRRLSLVGLIVLLGASASCDTRSASDKRRELLRVRCPDGAIDAVVEYVTTDHMSADIQEVYLVPARDTPNFGKERRSFYVSHLSQPLDLRWRGDSVLEIGFDKAYIQSFSNVEYVRRSGMPTRIIELRLSPANPQSLPSHLRGQ